MLRRLCGSVKCNASPKPTTSINNASPKRNNAPKRTRINNVKNYLTSFDPKNIKITNKKGVGSRRIIRATMYINGKEAGYAGVEIDPHGYAEFNLGRTYSALEGKHIGRILRALLTKAVINAGNYNKITHEGSNINHQLRANNKNKRPISTRIMQNKLGYTANKTRSNKISYFRKGNNISIINKTLNNYKKGFKKNLST